MLKALGNILIIGGALAVLLQLKNSSLPCIV